MQNKEFLLKKIILKKIKLPIIKYFQNILNNIKQKFSLIDAKMN